MGDNYILLLQCRLTSTETIRTGRDTEPSTSSPLWHSSRALVRLPSSSSLLLYVHRDRAGWGVQDVHLDFHTAPQLLRSGMGIFCRPYRLYKISGCQSHRAFQPIGTSRLAFRAEVRKVNRQLPITRALQPIRTSRLAFRVNIRKVGRQLSITPSTSANQNVTAFRAEIRKVCRQLPIMPSISANQNVAVFRADTRKRGPREFTQADEAL